MKTALAFSGGKDSWACLWLYQEHLKDITVIWVNTGKTYPEIEEAVSMAKSLCQNFVEIKVDRDQQNENFGLPSDVVPINWTHMGQVISGIKPVKIQSYLVCCYENIGWQLVKFCQDNGYSHLIRGQRSDEDMKSTARNGTVFEGVTFIQPLDNWSSDDVFDYLRTKMKIPSHFSLKHTSMDCYDCTAFSKHTKDRVDYTMDKHPNLHAEYAKRKQALDSALTIAIKEIL